MILDLYCCNRWRLIRVVEIQECYMRLAHIKTLAPSRRNPIQFVILGQISCKAKEGSQDGRHLLVWPTTAPRACNLLNGIVNLPSESKMIRQ